LKYEEVVEQAILQPSLFDGFYAGTERRRAWECLSFQQAVILHLSRPFASLEVRPVAVAQRPSNARETTVQRPGRQAVPGWHGFDYSLDAFRDRFAPAGGLVDIVPAAGPEAAAAAATLPRVRWQVRETAPPPTYLPAPPSPNTRANHWQRTSTADAPPTWNWTR
jgi:hypothetical protein